MCIIFDGVERYELSLCDYVFCGNEILHVYKMDEHTVKIVFLTDHDVETMVIKAKEVSHLP
ncbi:MAG: hypothetical protein NC417_08455 [Candidatus Gastranaerophilales bacterium]|nr:hypothetical protein [Candidatus Gastranaerophilales bacterium]